jgi:hypothetical protein
VRAHEAQRCRMWFNLKTATARGEDRAPGGLIRF